MFPVTQRTFKSSSRRERLGSAKLAVERFIADKTNFTESELQRCARQQKMVSNGGFEI